MNSRLDKNKNMRKKIITEEKKRKKEIRRKVANKILLFILIIFLLGIVYSSLIETRMLFVKEKKIISTSIGTNFDNIKIVHFSDLHFGSTIHEKDLKRIVNKINKQKPDIVIFTGDLIEEKYEINDEEREKLTIYLKKIETKYGKYAIVGNHDYYNEDFHNIIYDADFMLLNNSYDVVYSYNNESIGIYGLDDFTYGDPSTDKALEKEFVDANYKIVLMHEPDYVKKIISYINPNLILAGHSHNQQIRIPFIKGFWLPEGSKTYYEPYYKINDTDIYISNGIGTSIIKLRFLSPPSFNVYKIIKK